jgi:hypothetical protein
VREEDWEEARRAFAHCVVIDDEVSAVGELEELASKPGCEGMVEPAADHCFCETDDVRCGRSQTSVGSTYLEAGSVQWPS